MFFLHLINYVNHEYGENGDKKLKVQEACIIFPKMYNEIIILKSLAFLVFF
jgi:hypothetical protein